MELHAQSIDAVQNQYEMDEVHSHDDFSSSFHQLIDHDHNPAQLQFIQLVMAISFGKNTHLLHADKHPLWLNEGLARPPRSEIL